MAWDFLDDLGSMGENLYGRAVDLGNEAIGNIGLSPAETPEKVTDRTPVQSDSKVPLIGGFGSNGLMIGGAVVVGVIALWLFTRK